MISISNDRILETVEQDYSYDQTQQPNEFREKRIEIEPNSTTQLTQRLTSQASNHDNTTDSESDNDEFWKRVDCVWDLHISGKWMTKNGIQLFSNKHDSNYDYAYNPESQANVIVIVHINEGKKDPFLRPTNDDDH